MPRELPETQALLENMGNLEGGFAKPTRIQWEEHKFPRDLDYRQSAAPVFTYSLHQQDAWHIGDTKKNGCFRNEVKLGLTLTSSDEQRISSTPLMLGKQYK